MLIDPYTRTGAMVLAINDILVTEGVFGLTLRRIARESGISTGSLLHHFGHRERMLGVAAHQTGLSMLEDIRSRSLWRGVEAFVPWDDEGVLLTRTWLSWCDLWRSEDWLTQTVGDLRTSTCSSRRSTDFESRCALRSDRCARRRRERC
jgi:AcrR family transcriptional regulator